MASATGKAGIYRPANSSAAGIDRSTPSSSSPGMLTCAIAVAPRSASIGTSMSAATRVWSRAMRGEFTTMRNAAAAAISCAASTGATLPDATLDWKASASTLRPELRNASASAWSPDPAPADGGALPDGCSGSMNSRSTPIAATPAAVSFSISVARLRRGNGQRCIVSSVRSSIAAMTTSRGGVIAPRSAKRQASVRPSIALAVGASRSAR